MKQSEKKSGKNFWSQGEHYVWASGSALALTLLFTCLLLFVILFRGLATFWPSRLAEISLQDGSKILGEIVTSQAVPGGKSKRFQLKIGNRDLYGSDFRWIDEREMTELIYPKDALTLERREHGNFYGYLQEMKAPSFPDIEGFEALWKRALREYGKIKKLKQKIGQVSQKARAIELKKRKLAYYKVSSHDPRWKTLEEKLQIFREEFKELEAKQTAQIAKLRLNQAIFADVQGSKKAIALVDIIRIYHPNQLSWMGKMGMYFSKLGGVFWENPRESNTEGGLFPAIFGTVMLVFLMSLLSFPLGVVAGIYLREYARQGFLVRTVRIAVNNLAGIPSIVYGIFGLAFFVYGVGGFLDQIFFPYRLPTPTFGTGGILWASLTLGLLTVPIVIVATEEALGTIPKEVREASYALGATKFQTLVKTVVPMASPGILTGLILAMARAAGEVAPLMITGVVKLAPSLPLDGSFPFFHPDRKFMHLGFYIYDLAFQSPNAEAAMPMIYVTSLLLVLIVLLMNSVAIYLRGKLKKRYALKSI